MIDMDRTIIVDDPEEQFSGRLEWAEKQREGAAEDSVNNDVAYFEAYQEELKERIQELQDGGISEQALIDDYHTAKEEWDEIEDPSEEDMSCAARLDTAKHVLEGVFGHGAVDVGHVVRASSDGNGEIELVGKTGNTVKIQVINEEDALARADLFLREAGYSVDDLQIEG